MTEAELLVFGANESGQLGLEASDSVPIPRTPLALQSQQITCVAFGFSHTLWLTSEGVVVVSGLNNVGQCGMSAPEQVLTPVRLEALATVAQQRRDLDGRLVHRSRLGARGAAHAQTREQGVRPLRPR